MILNKSFLEFNPMPLLEGIIIMYQNKLFSSYITIDYKGT